MFNIWLFLFTSHYMFRSLMTVAALSEAWTVFARSNTAIVGSNPTQGMHVCVCVYSVFVLSCVQVAALRRADHSPKESYHYKGLQSHWWMKKWNMFRSAEIIIRRSTDTCICMSSLNGSILFLYLYDQGFDSCHKSSEGVFWLGVKRPGCEVDSSRVSDAKVKRSWSYVLTFPRVFLVWRYVDGDEVQQVGASPPAQ
jgi:hypothetical protein